MALVNNNENPLMVKPISTTILVSRRSWNLSVFNVFLQWYRLLQHINLMGIDPHMVPCIFHQFLKCRPQYLVLQIIVGLLPWKDTIWFLPHFICWIEIDILYGSKIKFWFKLSLFSQHSWCFIYTIGELDNNYLND